MIPFQSIVIPSDVETKQLALEKKRQEALLRFKDKQAQEKEEKKVELPVVQPIRTGIEQKRQEALLRFKEKQAVPNLENKKEESLRKIEELKKKRTEDIARKDLIKR